MGAYGDPDRQLLIALSLVPVSSEGGCAAVRRLAVLVVLLLAACSGAADPSTPSASVVTGKDWGSTDPAPGEFAVREVIGADGGRVQNDYVMVDVAAGTWAAGSEADVALGVPLGTSSGPHTGELWGAPVKVDHPADLAKPVTITWDVAALSPAQQSGVRMVRWDEDLQVWRSSPEKVTVTDGKASAQVSEFSIVDWISNPTLDMMQTFGEWAGKRAEAPKCSDKALPSWVSSVVRPDEDLSTAALRTCVELDKDGVLTVRVANNRSHGTLLTLTPDPVTWAWVWTGQEDATPVGGMWASAHAYLDNDTRTLMPPARTMAFGVERPAAPAQSMVKMSAQATTFTVFVDLVGMVVDSIAIGGMDNPLAQAFLQGMWQCGGKTLAGSRPGSANEMVATVVDAVRGCAGGVFGVDSNFADLVGTAYEDALRAEIAKGGDRAKNAIKVGRMLNGVATKLALLKVAELAEYATMLGVDAAVGATAITVWLQGKPPKLGAWDPGCKDAGSDSSALYKNLALQDEFADKSKELWQFPTWASASRTAVKPLTDCGPDHRESVAKDVEQSWADPKAATVVAKAIRDLAGTGSGTLPPITASFDVGTRVRKLILGTKEIEPSIPINYGCEAVSVLGANLDRGDADLVVGSSLCDGDVVSTWYLIRSGRVKESGWASVEAGVGDVSRLEQLFADYDGQKSASFNFSPADETWELEPIP